MFAHREAYEQVVAKTEEKLQRARADYKRAYASLLMIDGGSEQELKRAYYEAHNAYVLQLKATNAITERYQSQCLPSLLGEIAEVYEELCGLACKCVAGISEAAAERAGDQAKRYQAVAKEAQVITPLNDLQVRQIDYISQVFLYLSSFMSLDSIVCVPWVAEWRGQGRESYQSAEPN